MLTALRPSVRRTKSRRPPHVSKEQLWAPVTLHATLPLSVAFWINREFVNPKEREAFISTALIIAVEAAKKLGARKGGAA